jgi:hypothetical protein
LKGLGFGAVLVEADVEVAVAVAVAAVAMEGGGGSKAKRRGRKNRMENEGKWKKHSGVVFGKPRILGILGPRFPVRTLLDCLGYATAHLLVCAAFCVTHRNGFF